MTYKFLLYADKCMTYAFLNPFYKDKRFGSCLLFQNICNQQSWLCRVTISK